MPTNKKFDPKSLSEEDKKLLNKAATTGFEKFNKNPNLKASASCDCTGCEGHCFNRVAIICDFATAAGVTGGFAGSVYGSNTVASSTPTRMQ